MRLAGRVGAILAAALLLAACGRSHVVRTPSGPHAAAPARVSQPKYGATATVKRGDTLYRIATGNGISVLDLAVWNDVAPPYTIYPGQRLRLYPGGPAAGGAARRATTAKAPVPKPVRPPAAAAAPPAASTRPVPATAAVRPPAPVAAVPADSRRTWRWPADGELIGRYVPGEPTRQGIDIAGKGGVPVRAAGDGVVVYSGAGLVGYGELIIVKHDDSWLSAYGHNRARLVNVGQLVNAGQQIAEMGRSGAARDMLHFEIRYNGKPVDPLQYLPKR